MIKSNDLKVLKNISALLGGNNTTIRDGIREDLILNDMFYFKYAYVIFEIVERSFYSYRNILSDYCSFLIEYFKIHLTMQCNNKCTGEKNNLHFL